MTLQEYYKREVAKYGGFVAIKNKLDSDTQVGNILADDIYFNDEMDYNICANYYGMYVGADENWRQEDIDFLEILGFGTGDFLEEGENE